MERGWRRHAPALALAVLSPAIAELLSGSTRITLVFYAPLWFALDFAGLMLFYGGGALLIREAAVRWGKGWASVLLLGAAYGIVEEGLAIHTFFQPVGGAVGALGSFGRWGGVDLLWALGLTAYHAVISIALPILLIELTFPATRGQRFLSRRSAIAVGAGYVGIVSLFAVVEPDFPSPELFALALGAVGLLVLAARWAPRNLLLPRPGRPSARPWAFVLAGSGLFVDWLIAGLAGPSLFPSAILAGSVFVAGLVAVLLFVLRSAGTENVRWAQYWFAAGMIGIFFVWDGLLEFVLVPGILLVSASFLAYLWWLHRRLEREAVARGPLPEISVSRLS